VIVVKFGGASLAGVDRMRAAARIVAAHQRRDQRVVCVVSAMAGVTDALIRIGEYAAQGRPERRLTTTTAIRAQHLAVLTALTTTTPAATAETLPRFNAAWLALEADLARLASSAGVMPPDTQVAELARFSAWGERLSTLLFTSALLAEGVHAVAFESEPVVACARRAHVPENEPASEDELAGPWAHLAPSVPATRAALAPQVARAWKCRAIPVMPGYIARSDADEVITLGRNGSDHSAALIGVAPEADLLPALTYGDAAALAWLGARIVHPAAVRPVADRDIPLHLRSALTPEQPGTIIASAQHLRAHGVKAHGWAIATRPATTSDPLLGLRDSPLPEADLVIVSCLLFDHMGDDTSSDRADESHFQLIVRASEAALAQRQLVAMLSRFDQRSAMSGAMSGAMSEPMRPAPALHMMEAR
jgi:aspartokinase